MTASALDWLRGLRRGQPAANLENAKTTTGGGQQSSDPVEVYRAANELEAHVVKGLLESNDIPVMLVGESLGTRLGVSVGRLAEVRVMVPALLAPRALELLEEQAQESSAAPDDTEASSPSVAGDD